ncbi:MAG: hypothetical protein HY899_06400 [Deltaproteobacteria bacterium]|nr:hypothetical protein [Deltaproteobacteria bacterium]
MISFRTGRAAASDARAGRPPLTLEDGARVAVVGGGPAGSFFSYFLLNLAHLVDLDLKVDIFEPRPFTHCGPAGCNHCGGIVSESLVQLLAAEGVNLPLDAVQRGIDSYQLHMDVGQVRIETPLQEQRIAAVYRGNGPRSSEPRMLLGFDRFLQELACEHGATLRRRLVTGVEFSPSEARIACAEGDGGSYDFVAVAAGINTALAGQIAPPGTQPRRAQTLTTFICEFHLGSDVVDAYFGNSMHVFLIDLPRLEFAALIPKGEYVTMCMLGHDVDEALVNAFLNTPQVRECFPGGRVPDNVCHCFPRINVRQHPQPFGDRFVMIGDCGVTRLYKDGIGSSYRTAKAAALTAVLHGIGEENFRDYFAPTCRAITRDNAIGRAVFQGSHLFQRFRFTRRALLRMTTLEQQSKTSARRLSGILWDVFSGSAPYNDVMMRGCHPSFLAGLLGNLVAANLPKVGRSSATGSSQ